MLTEPRPLFFSAQCDRCPTKLTVTGAVASVRIQLVDLGWMEAAQKGLGRARWLWWCPACAPKRATSWGRTTP